MYFHMGAVDQIQVLMLPQQAISWLNYYPASTYLLI